MAVVINEFEVMPQAEVTPNPPTQNEPAPATETPVEDVQRLLSNITERAARVRAH